MNPAENEPWDDSRPLYENRRLDKVANRWSAKAADWDRNLKDPQCHLNEDGAYERFLATLGEVVAERQFFCRSHGVVDAGCATGLVLASIVSRFAWGIGVDISPEMIALAREKNIPNTRFLIGDCFELSKLLPRAGAVVSRGVLLSHYGRLHAKEFLADTRQALISEGFLFCDFLNQAARAKYRHAPANKTYFSAAEVCDLAREAGFATARVIGEAERRVQILLAQ